MSITSTTELKSFMGGLTAEPAGGQEALDTAEILVAAYIEADTLVQTVRAEEITPVRNRDTLEVTLAPVVTFTSITFGDPAETVSNTSADKWMLKAANGFSAGTVYTANYTSGWAADTLPDDVRRAIVATAEAFLDGGGRGISAEGVGDYARTSAQGEASMPLPPIARELLRAWRRPTL